MEKARQPAWTSLVNTEDLGLIQRNTVQLFQETLDGIDACPLPILNVGCALTWAAGCRSVTICHKTSRAIDNVPRLCIGQLRVNRQG